MKTLRKGVIAAGLSLAFATLAVSSTQAAEAELDCTMRFDLTGWSAIYKHAEGAGVVTCENGKTMNVKISANGGGLTVGKAKIENGKGEFSDVYHLDDILGTYAQGEATAAAGKAATAQVLTKGNVSLALAGTGEGVNLGISFGGFTISKAD